MALINMYGKICWRNVWTAPNHQEQLVPFDKDNKDTNKDKYIYEHTIKEQF